MKTDSLTNLLKQLDNIKLSAVKANKILVATGYLEEKERPSSKYPGKIKKYKSLTEKGLKFGENRENPNTPGQTTPYYYTEMFSELLAVITSNMDK